MSKDVVLHLNEKTYNLFKDMAKREKRPLAEFIELAALRYVEDQLLEDAFETGDDIDFDDMDQDF